MKKNLIRTTALALGASLLLGIGAAGASVVKPRPAAPVPALTGAVSAAKDETVYVLSAADGKAQQIIVSSWLQNAGRADTLRDRSSLNNIQNVKGLEDYTLSSDGTLLWNAAGQDIYYQGTSTQPLPVELTVSYTLDGKPISPADLAGKSGHITIRYDYENRQAQTLQIGKQQQKLFTPFLMLTGTMLDADRFRNVTAVNAKAENLGNQIAVVGFALPGMQENLKLSGDGLSIPSFIEIQADVEDCRLGASMTLGTASLFGRLDPAAVSGGDLKSQAQQLTGGAQQLLEGSGSLYDGLNTLLEQSSKLIDGVDQLCAGSVALQAGAESLSGGAAQLQSGAESLSSGLNTLDANSSALNDGARQVFETLLSTANEQLAAAGLAVSPLTIQNYSSVLDEVITSLDENAVYQAALEQVTAGVNARRSEVEAAVTEVVRQKVAAEVRIQVSAAVREQVTAAVMEQEGKIRALVIFKSTGLTPSLYEAAIKAGLISEEKQQAVEEAVDAAVEAEIEKQMGSQKIQDTIDSITEEKTDEQMASPDIQATISENVELQIEKLISETMASPEVQAQLQAAAEGAQSIIGLKASLDAYNGFYLGLLTYTGGVSTAAAGAQTLVGGVSQLQEGADALRDGVGTLTGGLQAMQSQTPALVDGITALRDGSGALKDGMELLLTQGIQKIADLAEEDLELLTQRLSACIDAARNYRSFSGLDPQAEGSVKFIYKTASIG